MNCTDTEEVFAFELLADAVILYANPGFMGANIRIWQFLSSVSCIISVEVTSSVLMQCAVLFLLSFSVFDVCGDD